jgi:hypothetical protein
LEILLLQKTQLPGSQACARVRGAGNPRDSKDNTTAGKGIRRV